jgi:AcrR family transcriptional regulator
MGERLQGTSRRGAEATEPRSRREILDAAARLLRSHGYKSTTLRVIAEEVGIKAGSIYYHFESKEQIVAAVMNDGVDRVYEAVAAELAATPPAAGPREMVERAIRAHLGALLAHSDYTSAALRSYTDAPEAVRRSTRVHRRRYEAVWEALIEEVIAAGAAPAGVSAESLRLAVLGMMNWSAEWYRPNRHSIERLAHEFAALVVR